MRKKFLRRFPGRRQYEREILSLLVSRPLIEKSPSNFSSHVSSGEMPIGRDSRPFASCCYASQHRVAASHRSVIKNDKGKWEQRRFSRAGQVQITGAMHGVGWKLVLGIEGGAQGNCYTARLSTARPYVTLLHAVISFSFVSRNHLSIPCSFLYPPVHHGNQFPSNYSY